MGEPKQTARTENSSARRPVPQWVASPPVKKCIKKLCASHQRAHEVRRILESSRYTQAQKNEVLRMIERNAMRKEICSTYEYLRFYSKREYLHLTSDRSNYPNRLARDIEMESSYFAPSRPIKCQHELSQAARRLLWLRKKYVGSNIRLRRSIQGGRIWRCIDMCRIKRNIWRKLGIKPKKTLYSESKYPCVASCDRAFGIYRNYWYLD